MVRGNGISRATNFRYNGLRDFLTAVITFYAIFVPKLSFTLSRISIYIYISTCMYITVKILMGVIYFEFNIDIYGRINVYSFSFNFFFSFLLFDNFLIIFNVEIFIIF